MENVWLHRRTTPQRLIGAPGPDESQMRMIAEAAGAAPDHGKIKPWRFLMVTGEARANLGRIFVDAQRQRDPETPEDVFEKLSRQTGFAPLILVAIFSPTVDHPKISVDEQYCAASAAVQNVLLCATQMGFASKWSTGWLAENSDIRAGLGIESGEKVLGFLHIGSRIEPFSDEAIREPAPMASWTTPIQPTGDGS